MNVAHQAPLSMEFSRQEYWSGLPFPSPENLPDTGIEPVSPALADKFFTTAPPGMPINECRATEIKKRGSLCHLPAHGQVSLLSWASISSFKNKLDWDFPGG